MRYFSSRMSCFLGISVFFSASGQSTKDSIQEPVKSTEMAEVVIKAKKPTVESKVDRTVFNVADSSILAGNTTWDVLRMTPLISIDNKDEIKAEGEAVTVYINDRKSVFTGKELKEYLKTIPADNLKKIEIITNPSSRYDSAGQVVNIVLKKLENEGWKGSATFTNAQSYFNNPYSNLNLSYHKNNFTQTLSLSYGDNTTKNISENNNLLYESGLQQKIHTTSIQRNQNPATSYTAEWELNDKNTVGLVTEYYYQKNKNQTDTEGENSISKNFLNRYVLAQNRNSENHTLGSNIFYKFYDKDKNRIFDVNLGVNYDGEHSDNQFLKNTLPSDTNSGSKILTHQENREYYLKLDYTQPLGTESNIEFGGKSSFKNNRIPNTYYAYDPASWMHDASRSNDFQYEENLHALYINYSTKLWKVLESRIGLRYEYIRYIIRQHTTSTTKENAYGILLPDILLRYEFNNNYNLSFSYKHNIWRPYFAEFNPFLMPNEDGNYYKGNMDLVYNPSDRFNIKFGIKKKYFISATYHYTGQDYWGSFRVEDGKTVSMPENFLGNVHTYTFTGSTNQSFLKNKLNINLDVGVKYIDNSDFNRKNNLQNKNYLTNLSASTNISYTNIAEKNINLNIWAGYFVQNQGNSIANRANVFHTISMTKIFPVNQMEISLQLNNIFLRPVMDLTTYTPVGTFQNYMKFDWYGASLTFVKRFGNQKVKDNSKTSVEKDIGGGK